PYLQGRILSLRCNRAACSREWKMRAVLIALALALVPLNVGAQVEIADTASNSAYPCVDEASARMVGATFADGGLDDFNHAYYDSMGTALGEGKTFVCWGGYSPLRDLDHTVVDGWQHGEQTLLLIRYTPHDDPRSPVEHYDFILLHTV